MLWLSEILMQHHELQSFEELKQKTAYEMLRSLVGSEMCIRDRMTIPPNPENRERPHSNTTGPVFMIDEPTQSLYMRYTARTRSIQWKDSPAHSRARRTLLEILNDTAYRFQYRLQGGEGVICNNVLHNRTMFTDKPQSGRLLYRARFNERVTRNPVNPAPSADHVVAE